MHISPLTKKLHQYAHYIINPMPSIFFSQIILPALPHIYFIKRTDMWGQNKQQRRNKNIPTVHVFGIHLDGLTDHVARQ